MANKCQGLSCSLRGIRGKSASCATPRLLSQDPQDSPYKCLHALLHSRCLLLVIGATAVAFSLLKDLLGQPTRPSARDFPAAHGTPRARLRHRGLRIAVVRVGALPFQRPGGSSPYRPCAAERRPLSPCLAAKGRPKGCRRGLLDLHPRRPAHEELVGQDGLKGRRPR